MRMQNEILKDDYIESFFLNLAKIFKAKSHFFSRIYLMYLYPGRYHTDRDFVENLKKVMDENKD